MQKKENKTLTTGQRVYTTVLLALVAIVAMTALTTAWFSIARRSDVYSIGLNIVSGPSLRIDLDPHETFEQYVKTLSFDQIAVRVGSLYGYDMKTVPLNPVTTQDGRTFTYRNGTVVQTEEGAYWECPLHFMASDDMIVHLTAENSSGAEDGTLISSDTPNLPDSMRVAFEADDKVCVYDPGRWVNEQNNTSFQKILLQLDGNRVYNQDSILFPLVGNQDKTVILRVWMEGTDEACTDALKGSDFMIRLRFEGTDENGNRIDGRRSSE